MAIAEKEHIGKRISQKLSDSIYPKLTKQDILDISESTGIHKNTIVPLLKGESNLTNYNSVVLIEASKMAFRKFNDLLEIERKRSETINKFIESWEH